MPRRPVWVVWSGYPSTDAPIQSGLDHPKTASPTSSRPDMPPPSSTGATHLADTADAITHLESGRTRGKIAIAIDTTEER